MSGFTPSPMSRRGFLGLAAAAAAVPTLAACNVSGSSNTGGSGGSADPIKFWDQPWGATGLQRPGQEDHRGLRPASGDGQGDLPDHSVEQLLSDLLLRDRVWNRAGRLQWRWFPAVPVRRAGGDRLRRQAARVLEDRRLVRRFPAGILEANKVDGGYAAVPWQLDARIVWSNKALLEKAGVEAPTDFDSWISVGKALKKIGVFGYGIGTGAGNNLGSHSMVALMIMNGGGLFTPDGKADCVTDRNIESMDLVRQMVSEGIIDPGFGQLHHRQPEHPVGQGEGGAGLQRVPPCRAKRRRLRTIWRWSARSPARTATRRRCTS